MSKTRLLVDAAPLVDTHVSGVGQATFHVVDELSKDRGFTDGHSIGLVVPANTGSRLSRWGFNQFVTPRSIPLPGRVLGRLTRHNLMPPMDLLLGRGTYLFPNFRNWPLCFSTSITYVHDIAFALHPQTVEPSNLAHLAANVPTWIARATWVVTVSETSKREIVETFRVDPAKVAVAFNGVDRTRYRRSAAASTEGTKRDLGIAGEYLLYVGNIEPRKNLRRLIAAYRSLPATLTDRFALVLVGGGGWLNEEILEDVAEAQRNGFRIVRPGRFVENSEVIDLYSDARCVVLPSLHEGFGMPVLEALACGTRVVAADIGSLREAGGDVVEYCEPLSVESIAGALRRTLETEPAADFARRAEQHVSRFTWARTAAVIKRLIG